MMHQEHSETLTAAEKTFAVGGTVFANQASEYEGLFGEVREIRAADGARAKDAVPNILCEFQLPESAGMLETIEGRFSALYGYPRQLKGLPMGHVAMSPDMLVPIPDQVPEAQGKLYALTYYRDDDMTCDVGTLALSRDIGALLRCMLTDLETYEIEVVLFHVERTQDGYRFSYEAKNTGVEGLYLGYLIAETSVLPDAAPHAA